MAYFTVTEIVEYEPAYTNAPYFDLPLEAIVIIEDFANRKDLTFEKVSAELPELKEKDGDDIEEPTIQEIEKYPFLEFDGSILTVDPNELTAKDIRKGIIEMVVVATDSNGDVGEYSWLLMIKQYIPPFKGVTVEPEPEPEPPKPVVVPVIEEVNPGPELFARISDIDNLGIVKVTFNQKLAFKSKKNSARAGSNETATSGRRLQEPDEIDDQILELTMTPGDYDGAENANLSKLDFFWELEDYDDETQSLSF